MTSALSVSIAIIGSGLIGPRHAESVRKCPEAHLFAIVEPSPIGSKIAAEYGAQHFKSITSMLESGHNLPNAAIICTPNQTHVQISTQLLKAGIHVLVEKPVSTDIPSGRQLLQTAKETGLRLLIGHHRRFNTYLLAAKAAIDSGSLGKIIAVNGLWTTQKSQDYFDAPMAWHRDASAGVILTNFIHEVDLLQYMFGSIVRVHAEPTVSQRGYAADEGAAITMRFEAGIVGTFLICDGTPSPHNFEAGTGENPMIPREGEDFYRIFGTRACLSVPDMTRWSYDGRVEKGWKEPLRKEVIGIGEVRTPFDLQIEHLVRVVRGQEEPICPGEAGLQAMVVCDAVRKAMATGETVNIAIEGRIAKSHL